MVMQLLLIRARYALRFLPALLLALALILPAHADEQADRKALDVLFTQLKAAPDADSAVPIVNRIWYRWLTPSDPVLASRMRTAVAAREAGDTAAALELLDKLVVDFPNYAEAWNQRATIKYLVYDFDASLKDIEKTLALEPRHFGALSGRAMIYLAQHKRPLALKAMIAALAINPFLAERKLFPELMQDITRI
jgi:tetratricopeptide (TPR) repeat protein